MQALDSADKPLSRHALAQLAQCLQAFLAVSYDRLMGALRKELEPGLSISRHPREVFINFLHLARLCTAVVRLGQVRYNQHRQQAPVSVRHRPLVCRRPR